METHEILRYPKNTVAILSGLTKVVVLMDNNDYIPMKLSRNTWIRTSWCDESRDAIWHLKPFSPDEVRAMPPMLYVFSGPPEDSEEDQKNRVARSMLEAIAIDQDWMNKVRDSMSASLSAAKKRAENLMDFGDAIRALKRGKRAARTGWNGKGMWVSLSGPTRNGTPLSRSIPADLFWSENNRAYAESRGGTATVLPCFTMRTADGSILMGWLASQTDMLAEDWYVLDEDRAYQETVARADGDASSSGMVGGLHSDVRSPVTEIKPPEGAVAVFNGGRSAIDVDDGCYRLKNYVLGEWLISCNWFREAVEVLSLLPKDPNMAARTRIA